MVLKDLYHRKDKEFIKIKAKDAIAILSKISNLTISAMVMPEIANYQYFHREYKLEYQKNLRNISKLEKFFDVNFLTVIKNHIEELYQLKMANRLNATFDKRFDVGILMKINNRFHKPLTVHYQEK